MYHQKLHLETKYKSNNGSLMALQILSAPKENNYRIFVDENPRTVPFGYNSVLQFWNMLRKLYLQLKERKKVKLGMANKRCEESACE